MTMEPMVDQVLWDRFIDESINGTLFHKWDFLKLVEKYTGCRLYTYGFYDGNDLVCVIPFFLSVRSGGIRMMISPPPMHKANVPYLGFAMSHEFWGLKPHDSTYAMNQIIEDMHRGLRDVSPHYISIGLTSTIRDVRAFGWHDYGIDQQYTYTLDLTRPLEEIWEGFDRDCRKNIAACEKYSLSLRQVDDVDTFNEIMKNYLKHDLMENGETFYHRQSPEYIKDIIRAYPDNIKLYFFYNGDEIVGTKINVGYKGHYMSWMGNVAMQKKLSVNEFFYWELIKKAKAEGYKRHENYGTTTPRLNIFKAKFNPALEPCFYVEKKTGIYRAVEYCYDTVTGIAKVK